MEHASEVGGALEYASEVGGAHWHTAEDWKTICLALFFVDACAQDLPNTHAPYKLGLLVLSPQALRSLLEHVMKSSISQPPCCLTWASMASITLCVYHGNVQQTFNLLAELLSWGPRLAAALMEP